MSPKLILEFEELTSDEGRFFFDEKEIPVGAMAATVKAGPHKGSHLFSNKQRAEEFCWKYGFEPAFESASTDTKEK